MVPSELGEEGRLDVRGWRDHQCDCCVVRQAAAGSSNCDSVTACRGRRGYCYREG